jgi:hypothetical protein
MQSTELTRNADPPVNLSECWGDEFVALYNKYEASGKARKTIKAQELWFAVIEAQTETGTPYLLYKDACNGKSNQQVFFFLRHAIAYNIPRNRRLDACMRCYRVLIEQWMVAAEPWHHQVLQPLH